MSHDLSSLDEASLRRAFALAETARAAGHRPFGALVADPDGDIASAGSTQTQGGDPTAHAEMNAVRAAMTAAPRARLAGATLYASCEPCAMCAAATFYAGIGRIVFGLSEARLRPLRNLTSAGSGIALSSRDVLANVRHRIVVDGPHFEDDAVRAHQDYWADAV